MTLTAWLTIVGICCLGAMSPGPSLAVVLKHTLAGGRSKGMIAALTHGLGVGIYALLCISGMAFLITQSETVFTALQFAGAAYLAWLGIKGILSKSNPNQELPTVSAQSSARDGFMIVFLNPKIAVFFIALFSQVIGPETSWLAKLGYASTAMIIDGGWYALVAWLFSNPKLLTQLQAKAVWLDRLLGVVLVSLSGKLVTNLL